MSGAFTEATPEAHLIFDRFHVQRLAQDALEETRRDEVRAAADAGERKALESTRFPLLESPWNLTDVDILTLS